MLALHRLPTDGWATVTRIRHEPADEIGMLIVTLDVTQVCQPTDAPDLEAMVPGAPSLIGTRDPGRKSTVADRTSRPAMKIEASGDDGHGLVGIGHVQNIRAEVRGPVVTVTFRIQIRAPTGVATEAVWLLGNTVHLNIWSIEENVDGPTIVRLVAHKDPVIGQVSVGRMVERGEDGSVLLDDLDGHQEHMPPGVARSRIVATLDVTGPDGSDPMPIVMEHAGDHLVTWAEILAALGLRMREGRPLPEVEGALVIDKVVVNEAIEILMISEPDAGERALMALVGATHAEA